MLKYKKSTLNTKFNNLKYNEMYEKAQLRSNFRKKISPWLGLELMNVITFVKHIIYDGSLL